MAESDLRQPQGNSSQIGTIDRIQQNMLARLERRLLDWLCAHVPPVVSPDALTALGMLGAIMVFTGYICSNQSDGWLWLSIAGYFIHWLGDSMDGSLARYRRIERPRYGYFLDHSCDGLATVLVLAGIGLSSYVALEVALIALVGYLLLSIHAFLSVRVLGEMKLSYLNAGPTELRLILVALTFAMIVAGSQPVFFGVLTWFDLFVGAVGALLIVLFVTQTLLTAKRLNAEEPARRP